MNGKQFLWILAIVFSSTVSRADSLLDRYPQCGTGDTHVERLRNCGVSVMVTVSGDSDETTVMFDPVSGVFWGPKPAKTYTFEDAKTACIDVFYENPGYDAIRELKGMWEVPDPRDFARIGQPNQSPWNKHGRDQGSWFPFRAAEEPISGNRSWKDLPNWSDSYWTSSSIDSVGAWVFSAFDGSLAGANRYDGFSVRCVARR